LGCFTCGCEPSGSHLLQAAQRSGVRARVVRRSSRVSITCGCEPLGSHPFQSAQSSAHLVTSGSPLSASAADRNARALPSSSRDAGNRISFARLRGFTETRDFDSGFLPEIARAIGLTRRGFAARGPRCSSRLRPAIHSRTRLAEYVEAGRGCPPKRNARRWKTRVRDGGV
jgi:hypothetical protein